jgi:hypothetical protein
MASKTPTKATVEASSERRNLLRMIVRSLFITPRTMKAVAVRTARAFIWKKEMPMAATQDT